MKKGLITAALMAAPILLSSCGKQPDAPIEVASPDAMGDMAMLAEAKMAKGTGTVTAIDPASSKITLAHEPIPAVKWPAMTMGFTAKPELLAGIAVGDKVDFDLTVTGNAGEVTSIRKR